MSNITYQSICDKLGFDPMTRSNKDNLKSFEDWKIVDDPNPYASLSLRELDFLDAFLTSNGKGSSSI